MRHLTNQLAVHLETTGTGNPLNGNSADPKLWEAWYKRAAHFGFVRQADIWLLGSEIQEIYYYVQDRLVVKL